VADLIQIVDAAMAEAARKSGPWLACKPGCTPCCIGPFPISPLDAERLREGLAALRDTDPARADAVVQRARDYTARLPKLTAGEILEADGIAEDEPCPALDPANGTCDLYTARPLTCRVFGPAVRSGGAVGVCELCYAGATDEQIADCVIDLNLDELEEEAPPTLVAFALA
jgi:Fe-S-cluster containining protein